MLDFLEIETRKTKNGREVFPSYIVGKSNDLMIRGSDFYAIYDEETKMWSTDEDDVIRMIDAEIKKYVETNKDRFDEKLKPMYLRKSTSKMIDQFHNYCKNQCRQNYHQLDEVLIFSNTEIKKRSYATKKLPYPLEDGSIDAYEELISTLYSPEEKMKIEWAIGAIVAGESKNIQKFLVFYGAAGTGKSTVLNIIQKLFDGYYSVFDAKALGSGNNVFALEAFRSNPLVAIQHDGDLSHIEDNTRLNSLISHEEMMVNEKFKATYSMKFNAFLLMGTNKPVKITDAKSGLTRRLIDVSPTGNKVDSKRYRTLVKQIDFELGAIAKHCLEVYKSDPERYDDYIPTNMIGATNDFYNFVLDRYDTFDREDSTTLKSAWLAYKEYCEYARVPYPLSQRLFKEELKNYFENYDDKYEDGEITIINWYQGFLRDKFNYISNKKPKVKVVENWIKLSKQKSIFDDICSDCFAQLANEKETPQKKWNQVTTKLSDLNSEELHYVRVPENHIVIDFDLKDKDGNKSLELNLKAAEKWPETYAEVSKGGQGLHLHYIYGDDVTKLANVYDDDIEIKVFLGNSSLRRKLSLCNDKPIATINSGLPFRKEKKMAIDNNKIRSEKGLRSMIERNLAKEFHPGTKPSIDFINDILNDAYNDKSLTYDVTDMRNAIYAFAAGSTHQADYCIKLVNKMKFKSEEVGEALPYEDDAIYFYDVEVFPNLFIIVYKKEGEGNEPIQLINPSPVQVEDLCKLKLVGFNCRRYDNHILRARIMGYDLHQLFLLSQKIINGDKNALNPEAYGISYTDIYDYSSKKQSLKKWEIDLGIHHQENGIPWDEDVPEDRWQEVADYCVNDVIATEAVWNATKADWTARQILADIAEMSVNDTTNSLTTRIIFGRERAPQSEFNYRNMAEDSDHGYLDYDEFTCFTKDEKPVFPGYKFEMGKSSYRDVEEVGEGGYVYSEPGMYGNVALLDIASMHPTSIINERLFGIYTDNFADIKNARIAIKHEEFDKTKTMLGGKLTKYLNGDSKTKDLAYALKIAINSVYGLTSAKFANPFKDPRNIDNIVAKRGALFMINLRHEVQKRGYIVAHIKTDSIKIPDATPEIIKFVMDYGKLYGYDFEHEATYDRMTLVNDAVYIAKYATAEKCQKLYGYVPDDCNKHGGEWTATGTQFAVPYLFKKLFSHEDILFEDMCETKSVKEGFIYLDMNEGLPDVSEFENQFKKYESDYRKGLLSDTMLDKLCKELQPDIDKGHMYHFVGRVGNFCPIKDGYGGGVLYREKDGKYFAVTGTKGYRWLESEYVRSMGMEDAIDTSYYDSLCESAIADINGYGNYEWFVSDDPYEAPPYIFDDAIGMNVPKYVAMTPIS